MVATADDDALTWRISVLFEGGKVLARPATRIGLLSGKNNLLMLETTADYQALQSREWYSLTVNAKAGRSAVWPDAIGLYGDLLARGDNGIGGQPVTGGASAARWGFHLSGYAATRNTVSAFYARLAVVATCYLQDVRQQQDYN